MWSTGLLFAALAGAPANLDDEFEWVECGNRFITFWVLEVEKVQSSSRWLTREHFRITIPKSNVQLVRENLMGSDRDDSEAWVAVGDKASQASWAKIPSDSYDDIVSCIDD